MAIFYMNAWSWDGKDRGFTHSSTARCEINKMKGELQENAFNAIFNHYFHFFCKERLYK